MPYPFEKALMRRVGCETPPERAARETGAVSGLSAKHLKTVSERPLIGHVGLRYRQRKWRLWVSYRLQQGWNRVCESRNVPCNFRLQGIFLCTGVPRGRGILSAELAGAPRKSRGKEGSPTRLCRLVQRKYAARAAHFPHRDGFWQRFWKRSERSERK